MQPKNTSIIFLNSQTENDQQVIDILRQELQNRSRHDICLIAEENREAGRSAAERAAAIIKDLEEKNIIPTGQPEEEVYTEEEAEKIKKRLEDLGYL